MKLREYLNKLSVVVFLTTLAVVATATPVFAQITVANGETGAWTREIVSGDSPLNLQGLYSEARNAGNLLSVWRGATNNQVWMSLNNGTPFTIGGTVTFQSPTVAPFGSDSFMVFHTGDDGDIWFTQVFGDGHNSGTWNAVPGNFTNLPVSVAQMGPNSNNLFLVYRGLGNDLRVWGTWYDGQTNTWAGADNISGGSANNAPGVSMNNATNQLTVTVQGTDNQLWMTHQTLGASAWNSWLPKGAFTENTPHSAACANGNMVVSVIDGNGNPEFAKFDGFGDQESGWVVADEFPIAFEAGIQLTANGNNVYALADLGPGEGSGAWRMIYACN
jgi:hypothetical protein